MTGLKMRPLCFLSMDDLGSYVADDELALPPLSELGWQVSTLSWRQRELDWSDFEAVIIRTPWDYQTSAAEFLDVLGEIEDRTRLENPLEIVRWNLDKRYLREMSARGTRVVPTIWDARYSAAEFNRWVTDLDSRELIVKPTVSATAAHTYRLSAYDPLLEDVFSERPFMVQPFMPNIVGEGEYSLFYFNGEFSHAIKKSPKAGDFRVQEEHGGIITAIEPDERLHDAGRRAVESVQTLLYARVDFVRDASGDLCLMELELIEPALYLRMDELAPERFAAAIDFLLK